ncbi:MAG: hypothetical protein JW884_10340 [Deltaproteobacteria bacterium]|nr:hypothetical protein [Deltaproteobacteria bacterium]
MKKILVMACALSLSTGCVAVDQQMKVLEEEKQQLSVNLTTAQDRINDLTKEQERLRERLKELESLSTALEKEKTVRTDEAGALRQDVRGFLKGQMRELKNFSAKSDFLDYIGGELIERTEKSGAGMLLIDMARLFPSQGSLLAVKGFFTGACNINVVLLRPFEDQWLVVWKSDLIAVEQQGLQKVDFPVPVSCNKGDVVGYLFPAETAVPYDKGTGGMVWFESNIEVGTKIRVTDLKGLQERRAYSMGVLGLFE